MNQILKINSLNKSYNHIKILSNISININNGQTIGIFGENGSGKSTLLKIISGIIQPNSGSGELLGLPLFKDNYMYDLRNSNKYLNKISERSDVLGLQKNIDKIIEYYV